MTEEQAATAVIIALIFEKNKSRKKRQTEEPVWSLGLKEEKLKILWNSLDSMKFYCGLKSSIIIALYLRMTSVNFEEIFHLIKDNIAKENTKMRELIPPRL